MDVLRRLRLLEPPETVLRRHRDWSPGGMPCGRGPSAHADRGPCTPYAAVEPGSSYGTGTASFSASSTTPSKGGRASAGQSARSGFVRLLGRGDPRRELSAANRLDSTAALLEQQREGEPDRLRQELIIGWTARLQDFLADDPESATELRWCSGSQP